MKTWRSRHRNPQPEFGVLRATDVMVPMRDGVRLATDIYFPTCRSIPDQRRIEALPCILIQNAIQQDRLHPPKVESTSPGVATSSSSRTVGAAIDRKASSIS